MKNFTLTLALFVLFILGSIIPVGASSTMWCKTYGGTENDGALSLIQTSDGGYALVGYTRSFGAGEDDFWLIKTDEEGNMQWNRTYGGKGSDIASSLIETSDGGYAIAGYTLSFGAGGYDFWLVKTNEQGIPEFPLWTPLWIMLVSITVITIVYRCNLKNMIREDFDVRTRDSSQVS
jgi:hypothetical protein